MGQLITQRRSAPPLRRAACRRYTHNPTRACSRRHAWTTASSVPWGAILRAVTAHCDHLVLHLLGGGKRGAFWARNE